MISRCRIGMLDETHNRLLCKLKRRTDPIGTARLLHGHGALPFRPKTSPGRD